MNRLSIGFTSAWWMTSKSLAERVADDKDPLRYLLRGARKWGVPPSVFIGQRTVATDQWRHDLDTPLAMALEDYEAGLCPGGDHVLAETSKPEHADAYRPGERIRCHQCTAEALVAETVRDEEHLAGLLIPVVLDPAVVAQNMRPVPPLPEGF